MQLIKLEPHLMKERKLELFELYANPVRTTIAVNLKHCEISESILNSLAEKILYQVIREIDVSTWPPNGYTHSMVDRIIVQFLNNLDLGLFNC